MGCVVIMGCTASRDRTPTIEGANNEENFCFAIECKLKLHNVEFRDYQAAIKRFGYRVNMTEDHMKQIAPELNLNIEQMKENKESPWAVAYLDRDFSFLEGKHDVENLILMGWLLCKHWNDETQCGELWHIINPELTPFVTKREVLSVITRLAYIAVNLNYKMLQKCCEDGVAKENALLYHQRINSNRRAFLQDLSARLPD